MPLEAKNFRRGDRASKLTIWLLSFLAFSIILSSGAWADAITSEDQLREAANSAEPQIIDLGSDITVHGQLAPIFNGTLNGGNFAISLAPSNSSETSAVPLFGTLSSTAIVRDLQLQLSESAADGVLGRGMLSDSADSGSNIVDVHANGSVTSTSITAGGLIGNNSGTISRSSASVDVAGLCQVGGLVGNNSGQIEYSVSTGAVTSSSDNVGGVAGTNFGIILSSAAEGSVTGYGDDVGGLVGGNSGIIRNSASRGTVRGITGTNTGGLVGNNSGEVSNSISASSTSGVRNTGGLIGFSNHGTISNSIASGDTTGEFNYVGGLVGGSDSDIIDHSSSLGVTSGNSSYVGGLVGEASNSRISNSTSLGETVGNSFYVGGLVGHSQYSTSIDNSSASGHVRGQGYYVGGLVGLNEMSSTVSNSTAFGNVDSTGNYVGGLIGDNYLYSSVLNSKSLGVVTTSGNYVGGLVGRNGSSYITGSAALGEVDASGENIGSLLGFNDYAGMVFDSLSFLEGTTLPQLGDYFHGSYSYYQVITPPDPILIGSASDAGTNNFGIDLLNYGLEAEYWAQGEYINAGHPYLKFLFDRNFYSNVTPWTLTYSSDIWGSLTGFSVQHIPRNRSGSAIEAVPRPGYHFLKWSDNSTQNPRTDVNVVGDISVTANFAPDDVVRERARLEKPPSEIVLTKQDIAKQAITNALLKGPMLVKPQDFTELGIKGVNFLNLPILIKLLIESGIQEFNPDLIEQQIKIANALLAKQKKARQALKVKKASFESSSWTSFMPSLLLG
jgi:uncharacterized repeat protein (TIGR02543 family)